MTEDRNPASELPVITWDRENEVKSDLETEFGWKQTSAGLPHKLITKCLH
jgi:hypothetical protein